MSKYYPQTQNSTLNEAIKNNWAIMVHLTNKVHFRGHVIQHDNFTILLQTDRNNMLLYKHSIASLYLLRFSSGGATGKRR